MTLSTYGRHVPSVFDLLGRGEVHLTSALGWTIAESPTLARSLWTRLSLPGDPYNLDVALEVADDEGRTDLELVTNDVRVIIEAKKGWLLPGDLQLRRYVGRFTADRHSLMVTLSDSSHDWAASELRDSVGGVPVVHLPWDDVRSDIRAARRNAKRPAERFWLQQLSTYLAGATAVRDPAEQWVFVVVASLDKPGKGGSRTFRDFVTTERAYFHPFGKNWPKRPPVLMGFRWGGQVRQVNRVVHSEVVPNLQARWPDIPRDEETADQPHAIYDLGPDIPIPRIPTTGVYQARRVWVLLDQLLTQPTLVDAEKASKALTQPQD
jgi:hypothetical protein